eukprot:1628478-Rhodomonas_salina.2
MRGRGRGIKGFRESHLRVKGARGLLEIGPRLHVSTAPIRSTFLVKTHSAHLVKSFQLRVDTAESDPTDPSFRTWSTGDTALFSILQKFHRAGFGFRPHQSIFREISELDARVHGTEGCDLVAYPTSVPDMA